MDLKKETSMLEWDQGTHPITNHNTPIKQGELSEIGRQVDLSITIEVSNLIYSYSSFWASTTIAFKDTPLSVLQLDWNLVYRSKYYKGIADSTFGGII